MKRSPAQTPADAAATSSVPHEVTQPTALETQRSLELEVERAWPELVAQRARDILDGTALTRRR